MRPPELSPCSPQGGHPLAHLLKAFAHLSLLSQSPPPHESSHGHEEGKPLLSRERHGGLYPLLAQSGLSAELMESGGKEEGKDETQRVSQLVSECEGLLAFVQGLSRIPERPQYPGQMA